MIYCLHSYSFLGVWPVHDKMGDSGYKGISASQDSRFKNKEYALLKSIKFPAHFDRKVDMKKVELDVMKPWIATRVGELLGFDDDVVLEYASGMLEQERFPDPRKVQIQLTGFLESQTSVFMGELWTLLLSAQESPGGIPAIFVQQKKEELRTKREQDQQALREARERAQRAGVDTRGPVDGQRGASQWTDHRSDRRGYGNSRGRFGTEAYRHSDGHSSRHARDSGWGNRARVYERSPSDSSRQDHVHGPSRHQPRDLLLRAASPTESPRPRSSSRRYSDDDESDSRPRRRSRSRSVTPNYRSDKRSRKDIGRSDTRRAHRSRSRSITPDYRSEKRSRRDARKPHTHRRDASPQDTRGSPRRDRDTTPKMDKPRRSSRREHSDETRDDSHRRDRRSAPSSKWDEDGDVGKSHVSQSEHEREREAELRAKLLRAKHAQS